MNICIDCKYIATNGSHNWETYKCFHMLNPAKVNPVTGEKLYTQPYCIGIRSAIGIDKDCSWYDEREELIPAGIAEISPTQMVALLKNRKTFTKISSVDDI